MFGMIVIGEKDNLSLRTARKRARIAAPALKKLAPHDLVEFVINGYDDDVREIWDIPEARDYFVAFASELRALQVQDDNILPQTLETIRCCVLTQAGHTIIPMGTDKDTIREAIEQVIAHMKKNPLH